MTKKNSPGVIPDEVMKFAIDEIQEISNGEIILVAQDARLMQIEINKRRRLTDWAEKNSAWNEETLANLQRQIAREFSTLAYGRLVIKIQKGHVTQIERTIQSRFTGMDGEGI